MSLPPVRARTFLRPSEQRTPERFVRVTDLLLDVEVRQLLSCHVSPDGGGLLLGIRIDGGVGLGRCLHARDAEDQVELGGVGAASSHLDQAVLVDEVAAREQRVPLDPARLPRRRVSVSFQRLSKHLFSNIYFQK